MQSIVGTFRSRAAADRAVDGLRAVGLAPDRIAFVTPEIGPEELADLPTTNAEEPGIGKAITGYVGGVIGASGGLALGTVLAGALLPGVGPLIVAGLGGAILLGAGGAAAGAALGERMEHTLDTGVPRDDLPLYAELLKQNRSLVFAFTDSEEMADTARLILRNNGGEEFDRTRAAMELHRTGTR
jgi:hypothetical protein